MHARTLFSFASAALLLAVGCSSTSGSTKTPATTPAPGSMTTFTSSWKSPTARPLQVQGAKVAAVVIMSDVASRHAAEDKLASEISARGGVGVPMYTLVEPLDVAGEPIARDALEKADVKGVVVLHPSPAETEPAPQDYTKAPYNVYWDGYYSYGFGSPWDTQATTQSFVSVETLVYSLAQNQLVWAGKSKTTNPATLNELITEVASATATELSHSALLPPP
jgi:hypothetical protein